MNTGQMSRESYQKHQFLMAQVYQIPNIKDKLPTSFEAEGKVHPEKLISDHGLIKRRAQGPEAAACNSHGQALSWL